MKIPIKKSTYMRFPIDQSKVGKCLPVQGKVFTHDISYRENIIERSSKGFPMEKII
eukprot:UN04414